VTRVVVWGENVHDREVPRVREIYPDGMHGAIADLLRERLPDADVTTATLDQPSHGLGGDVLANTDVLLWWGHVAHEDVADEVVRAVHDRVLAGMGLVVLHSGHLSKVFRSLMGTSCHLRWRESDDREVVWTVAPTHPIARGLPPAFVLPAHETYSEFFDIPVPDDLVFVSGFTGGEVFRSGCCFNRGLGRVFYFSPGHETYPVYHQPVIGQVLANAVRWAAPAGGADVAVGSSPESATGWYEPVPTTWERADA
jgi:trehalose utilization protein